nr:hypothetical protein [Cressdnaviricota sp.]
MNRYFTIFPRTINTGLFFFAISDRGRHIASNFPVSPVMQDFNLPEVLLFGKPDNSLQVRCLFFLSLFELQYAIQHIRSAFKCLFIKFECRIIDGKAPMFSTMSYGTRSGISHWIRRIDQGEW